MNHLNNMMDEKDALEFIKETEDGSYRAVDAELITKDAAVLLSQKEELYLNNLVEIDVETALALTNPSSSLVYLELNKITSLDKETATALAALKGELNLHGMPELSDDAAEGLGKHTGRLGLGSIITLSPLAAKHLSNHVGSIDLRAIEYLSDEAAENFAEYQGGLYFPNELKTLSDRAAEAFSKNSCEGSMVLRSVENISDAALGYLSKYGGQTIDLGVKSLSGEGASNLAKFNGDFLELNSIDKLNDEAVDALCEFNGKLSLASLFTSGVSSLKSARKLSRRGKKQCPHVHPESWHPQI